jgi:hypothetical protein
VGERRRRKRMRKEKGRGKEKVVSGPNDKIHLGLQ